MEVADQVRSGDQPERARLADFSWLGRHGCLHTSFRGKREPRGHAHLVRHACPSLRDTRQGDRSGQTGREGSITVLTTRAADAVTAELNAMGLMRHRLFTSMGPIKMKNDRPGER